MDDGDFHNCDLAPEGWFCSRSAHHEGPCAAWPRSWKQRIKWAWKCKSLIYLFKREGA